MTESTHSPGQQRRRRRIRRLTAFAVIAALVIPAAVLAQSGYLGTWRTTYPGSTSDDTAGRNGCQLCHGSSNAVLNAYGAAVFNNPGGAIAEGADSDGDGTSNVAEINAGSQPGWTTGNANTIYDLDGSTIVGTNQPPPAGITGPLDPTPVVTPVPTPVVTPVPTPVVTPVPTPVVTPVPTPVVTPVPTPVVTPVPTPVPTPTPPAIDVADSTAIPGQEIDVAGSGFMAGSEVEVWLYSTPVLLKTVTAAGDGTFATTVRLPSGTTPGAHSIVAIGVDANGAALRLEAAITVSGTPTAPPTSTITRTGGSGTPALPLVLLVLLGTAGSAALSLAYEGRRRR